MKQIVPILSLLLFVTIPSNVKSQIKPQLTVKKELQVLDASKAKNEEKIKVNETNSETKKVSLNASPVKMITKPVLKSGLYNNITALKAIVVSNTVSDKTKLETTGSNATNIFDIKSSTTKKEGNNCYVTPRTLNITTTDFSYFTESSTPDFIKPGVVINYKSILDGKNTINTSPRNPMTVYLINTSAVPGLSDLSVDVENPQSISGINNALGSLTGKLNTQSIPANMSFEIMEINSEKQLQYAVTGSFSALSMISANFGVVGGNFSESYYYLIKFTQNMYNIAADPNTVSFVNIPSDASQLAYVSEVTYGRKGLMMIKTKKSMSDIKAEMEASANVGIAKGNISAFIKSINNDSSNEIRVFFYGGNSSVAARSIQESNVRNGFDKWVQAEAGNGLVALPISYKVKNLQGDQLKISSVFEQVDRNCVPKKQLKLKVTLLEMDGWNTNDSDKKGDYAVMQHVKYTANNKVKEKSGAVEYNAFKKKTPCDLAGDKKWQGAIALACGSINDQIHVGMNPGNLRRPMNNINNSVIFEISPEEVNDRNAKFEVETWVKEYSEDWKGARADILMNNDFAAKQQIPIYFVLAELQGTGKGVFKDRYAKDSRLFGEIFNNFGNEYVAMTKTVIPEANRTFLDAVFRAVNGDMKEKAFIYLRFELIE